MCAVYIGAGTDTLPIKFLNNKKFYYFDSQPFSEFGSKQCGKIMSNGFDGFSRPDFIPKLDKVMSRHNIKLLNKFDNTRIYSNGNKIVQYHTNIAIPDHYETIKNIIYDFDTLIVAGHDPDSIILDSTKKKIHFIGFEDTVYDNENEYECGPENPNGIINRLHTGEITHKFNKYTFYYNDGTNQSFNTWKAFYEFYLTTCS